MAGPYNAGTVFLQVVPSFRDVQKKIGQEAQKIGANLNKQVQDSVDNSANRAAQAATKAFKRMQDEAAKTAKTAGKRAGDEMGGALSQAINKHLDAAIKSMPHMKFEVSSTEVERAIAVVQARLLELRNAKIGIDLDEGSALVQIKALEEELTRLNHETPNIHVAADTAAATAQLSALAAIAEKLDDKNVRVDVKAEGAAKASAEVAALGTETGRAGDWGKSSANSFRAFNGVMLATAAIGTAVVPVLGAVAGGLALAGTSAIIGASGLGVLALGFTGIGDAVGALGDVQDNAAKDALQAAKTTRTAAKAIRDAELGLSRAREDAAERSEDAARRVADAERSLQRAREDAAQASADAAQRVADAQEQAADQVLRALDEQRDAEERLARTHRDAQEAQEDLTQARIDAAQRIEDLKNKQTAGALDERQALIDLFNATVHFRNTMADPGATNLDKEQASIDLERAQLNIKTIREENKRTAEEKKKADKDGVEGSEEVKTAQERVIDAIKAEREAREDLGKAAKAVDKARVDGARMVADALRAQQRVQEDNARSLADAQRAVSDAVREQGRAQRDNQRSLFDAQQRLTDAQAAYTQQVVETGELGSASMQKLNQAMGKLGPAGQSFARFLFSLRDDFYELRTIAQEGILPGVEDALRNLITTYGPDFKEFVKTMAGTLGDLFRQAGDVFTSPVWQSIFETFAKFAPQFMEQFGSIILNLLTGFGSILQAFAPTSAEFGDALVDLTGLFADWAASLKDSDGFNAFIDWLKRMGPEVWQTILDLGRALVNLAIAMAPFGEMTLGALDKFFEWIADMDPETLGAIVLGILSLTLAFQGLFGIVALVAALTAPFGLLIAAIVIGVALAITAIILLWQHSETFRNIVTAVWEGIKSVVGTVVDWLTGTAWPFIQKVWDGIAAGATWLWEHVLRPVFGFFAEAFRQAIAVWEFIYAVHIKPLIQLFASLIVMLYRLTIEPIFKLTVDAFKLLWTGMKYIWDHGLRDFIMGLANIWTKDVWPAIRDAVSWIGDSWNSLMDAAKKPIKWIVDVVLNDGLIDSFNQLARALHAPEIDRIKLPSSFTGRGASKPKSTFGNKPGFADGGIYPGYTPGRDIGYIAVSGGEAIMRPEWTRAVGSDYIDYMNALARKGGVSAIKGFLGGFASGGIVNWKGKRFTEAMVERLKAAQQISGANFRISQGGFRPTTSYSGSTHNKDAIDISSPISDTVVRALRLAQIAAWHRTPAQGPWGHHIHGVPLPGPGIQLSASALGQVNSYLRGGNGLGGKDDADAGGLGAVLGGAADWVGNALSAPVKWLKDKIQGGLDKLGNFPLANILKEVPTSLIKAAGKVVGGFFGGMFGGNDGPAPSGSAVNVVKSVAARYGWGDGPQWYALQQLVQHESGFRPNAQNPSSTAYGLFQFLDSTWGSVGGRKTSDPFQQAVLGLRYIDQRYGSPANAWAKWQSRSPHWYSDGGVVPEDGSGSVTMYDNGGYLPPGLSTVLNLTGKPEPVFTSDQWDQIERGGGAGGDQFTVNIPTSNYMNADEIAGAFNFAYRGIKRGGVYAGSAS